MNKFSIIVPIYNAEKYLQKCCSSILEQNYRNIELILVNDGSTDCSEEICKQISFNDSRVIYITIDNQGVSVARNIGIDSASGEYVMFVDSDDWLEPNSLEKIANSLKSGQDVYMFSYWQEYENFSRKIPMQSYDRSMSDLLNHLDKISELSSLLCTVWNKVYKRSILIENNIQFDRNISFGEDFVFNMDYFAVAENISSKEIFIYHYNCINFNSATHKFFINYNYYFQLMHQKFEKLISVKKVQNKEIMVYVFDFILERYDYALKGCLDNEMSFKKKCLFLYELIYSMDSRLRKYAKESRYAIGILVRQYDSPIFDFYVAQIILKKYLCNIRYRITIFLKGVKNGKYK